MAKKTFLYLGKQNKGYILSKILHKAPKGVYKWDIVYLEVMPSNQKNPVRVYVTPYEALIISDALLHSYVVWNTIKRKRKKIKK